MAEEEQNSGYIESPVDVRDYTLDIDKAQHFPTTFKLQMVRVKNQSQTSSCVAHALSEVVEYYNKKQLNKTNEQSITFIYGNRRNSLNKGKGMITRDALANMIRWGDVDATYCPGNYEVPEAIDKFEAVADTLFPEGSKSRFTSYFRLYSEEEIKTALMNYGPVVIGMTWYKDMKVVDGVLTTEKKNKDGGHCMVIYGWNEKGWLVQNSWGLGWGTLGTCVIPYDMKIREAWGITDHIVDENIETPYASPLMDWIARFINFIANIFRRLKK